MFVLGARLSRSGDAVRTMVTSIASVTLLAGVFLLASSVPAAAKSTPVPIMTTTPSTGAVGIGGKIFDTASVTTTGSHPATGKVLFTLFPPSDAGQCVNLKKPIFSSTVSLSGGVAVSASYTVTNQYGYGTFTWVAYYEGDRNNASNSSTCTSGRVTVTKDDPTISTTPSGTAPIGGEVSDEAVVTGDHPTGTVTFELFGANNAMCAGTPVTSTVTLVAGSANSGDDTPDMLGAYYWKVIYNGDANNASVTSPCGGTNADPEEVIVTKATPILTTTPSPDVPIDSGDGVSDEGTLSGGFEPTGTLTFSLFENSTCTSELLSDVEPLSGGSASSVDTVPNVVGTYYWQVTYSGDDNNVAITGRCGGTSSDPETVHVVKATPSISTTPSASVPSGGGVTDTATVSGGDAPTGTVTFNLYGDSTCSTDLIFTDPNEPLSMSFTVTTVGATIDDPGIYYWVVTYNGDANNNAVTSPCGSENVAVTKASPSIATEPEDAYIGGNLQNFDSATVTGGDDPSGTVTFALYYDGTTQAITPTCMAEELVAPPDTEPLSSGGSATSTDYSSLPPGFYYWVAAYSGDADNRAEFSQCGTENFEIDEPPAG
jgi:hypothetical protein